MPLFTPADDTKPTDGWYGWRLMIADLASLAAFTSGLVTGLVPLVCIGILGFLAGGPLIHALTRKVLVAFWSVLLRGLTPILGGVGGYMLAERIIDQYDPATAGIGAALILGGAAVGAVATLLGDWFGLARR